MRILLLGDGGSAHIQKWVISLTQKGLEIGLFSLHHFDDTVYKGFSNITILNNPIYKNARSVFSKLGYLTKTSLLKKQIAKYKPDILHAHYATSYGLLGTKTNFKPFAISVWGSDVYDFPKNSTLHKNLVKRILSKADIICSTSYCMKDETLKYTNTTIEIVSFGVDTEIFKPAKENISGKKEITIGIIKSLEKKYGIDFLIKAFNEVVKKSDKHLKLLIVGDGSKKAEYIKLCCGLQIADKVTFTGTVPHNDVIKYHRQIDIFVSLSTLDSESFGVSLVEAMACGKPVIVSDVAGFKEVIGNADNGIIVQKNSYKEAADAIYFYLENPSEALRKGVSARSHILQHYDWNKNVEQMIGVYKKLLR